jgi:broad specificity phosphatase PhoE
MESLHEAIIRFKELLNMITETQPGKTILVVSHFDIMIGYLIDIGFGSYTKLMHSEMNHTGYYVLENKGEVFAVKKLVGLKIRES